MATVKEVLEDAAGKILHNQSEEPLEQDDGLVFMRGLNDMMTMWAANGVNLGYTVVSSLGQNVTVADGALAGIKAKLAIKVAPQFKAQVSLELLREAKEGYKAILNLVGQVTSRQFPSTLPMGSGNTGRTSRRFYPSDEDGALATETGGSLALEDDTEEV